MLVTSSVSNEIFALEQDQSCDWQTRNYEESSTKRLLQKSLKKGEK